MKTKDDKTRRILTRNVVEVIDKGNLEKRLKSGEKLRIKLGIDPTGPKIHLGRAVALWKLKKFQELGHQIVLIIGDFTGLVGDASDKISARPMLTEEHLKKNMADYRKQIGKILDIKKTEFRQNSEWLAKLTMKEIIRLASLFTVHQMINRRNFKERFEAGQTIGLHEFLYPLLQGYDSVAIKADVEIGGTDQLFNLKAGRKIQEFYGQTPQDIMTLEMLPGLDGEKMSTSRGNIINITDEANEMYGKIMSMKDELISEYFLRCTDLSEEDIKKKMVLDFFQAKNDLAFEIVRIYHGEKTAEKAREYFKKTFQEKKLPQEMPEIHFDAGEELIDVLVKTGIVASRASFRRLVQEGAIEINQKILKDVHYRARDKDIIRIGKKKFLKAII